MGPYSGLSLRGCERLCPSVEHGIIVLVLNCNVLIADSCSLQEFEGSSHIPSTKLTMGQARDHGDCCVQKMECKTVVVSSSIGSVVTTVNSKQRNPEFKSCYRPYELLVALFISSRSCCRAPQHTQLTRGHRCWRLKCLTPNFSSRWYLLQRKKSNFRWCFCAV